MVTRDKNAICRSSPRDFSLSACGGADINQRAEDRGLEIPYSGCGFVLHEVGGEWLMSRECPGFGWGDDSRKGGVKAPEDRRSPSPGGMTASCGNDERVCGLRRGVNETRGGRVGMAETRESRFDFALHDTGSEWVIQRDCPEFSGPKMSFTGGNYRRREAEAGEGREDTWRKVARAGHALTGLMDFFAGLTWAFARRTRSSPGYPLGGLQPQQSKAPREAKAEVDIY